MKKRFKKLLSTRFESLLYFYGFLRYRLFLAVVLSICVGVLDGFGLTMFLPILQMADQSSAIDADSLGNLRFIMDAIRYLNIPITIVSLLCILVLFFILKGVAKFFAQTYKVYLQQYFIRKIRIRLLNALNAISFKAFVSTDVGRIQNTMSGEVDRISRAYNYYFGSFQQGIMVAVYMGFAFVVDMWFAALVSLGGMMSNLLYNRIYKRTKGASKKLTKDSNVYQGLIIQHVNNFKYLKATGIVDFFGDRLRKSILQIEDNRRNIGVMSALLMAAREPMMLIVVAAVIMVQVQLLGGTLAPILISLLFFYRALSSLMILQESWNKFLEVSGSLDNMQDFQKELDDNGAKFPVLEFARFNKSIVFSDVGFAYGSDPVLQDINLTINKNETVAFVGESGSGKTTIVNMISGLLPATRGKVIVDGIDLSNFDLTKFQRRIGYITQDPVIFNDTIFNNVTLWAEKSPEMIRRFESVVKLSALWGLIQDLPLREDTMLGHNGINLSGGQRQRVSIAREIFKDIDILIMDEATSALDSETEKYIQESIERLKGTYTILVVAHRLSTIRKADRIVFMRRGKIESIGNYENLLLQNPQFKKMVELQEI